MNKDKNDVITNLNVIVSSLIIQKTRVEHQVINNRLNNIIVSLQDLIDDIEKMERVNSSILVPSKTKAKRKLSKKEKNEKRYNDLRAENNSKKTHMAPKGRNASRVSSSYNSSGGYKFTKDIYKKNDYDD